jgi:ABC-type uncharacterized transport system permease subunit
MNEWMRFIENLVLLGYVGALAFAFLFGGFRLERLGALSVWSLGGGFTAHTALLAILWRHLGYCPATTLPQLCSAMSWVLVLLYLALFLYMKNTILTFFLTPLVTLTYILSLMLPRTPVQPKEFYYTSWFVVHILLLLVGMGFFFLSFLYASVHIMQDHRLKVLHGPPRLALPPLQEAQKWATRFLLWGYPPFTLGIFSSVAYGIRYGGGKDWHPGLMEAASVMAWLVLGLAIYGFATARVRPKRRSWLIVAGASFSVLIILGILWH